MIDFGIAKATGGKLTEKTLFTEHRQLIGTPEYMSPEQAEKVARHRHAHRCLRAGRAAIRTAHGQPAVRASELRTAAYGEIQRIIREVDPPKPSTRLSQSAAATITAFAAHCTTEPRGWKSIVRGELDWIVMKAWIRTAPADTRLPTDWRWISGDTSRVTRCSRRRRA